MAENQKILLSGGILLQHTAQDEVDVLWDTDIPIRNDTIAQVGKNLEQDINTQLIDCRGKTICPGFVDTHHHVWQTQFKGRHSDDTLLDYHPKGNLQWFNYTPQDVFWGELGGLLEAIDGGTTTVVDHAHMSRSPDHVPAGVSATMTTSIRSVFCYSLVPNIKRWDEDAFELESSPIPDWFIPTLNGLSNTLRSTNGKISLGFGFDGFHLPKDTVLKLFETVRKAGAKVITSHWRRNNMAVDDNFSIPQILNDYELLASNILLSHGTGSTEAEFCLLREHDAYISSTPATETQMAHGDVVCFRDGVLASIGADCHSNNPGSLLHSVQTSLAAVRAQRNASVISKGKFPRYVEPTTLHAFNLATIHGARAIGLEDQIGSLKEGKQADIAIFNTTTPAMVCAAEQDPIATVIRHAGHGDIDTVFIGGKVVKSDCRLCDMTRHAFDRWDEWREIGSTLSDGKLRWSKVAAELQQSRRDVQERIDRCNIPKAREAVMKVWGMTQGESIFAR